MIVSLRDPDLGSMFHDVARAQGRAAGVNVAAIKDPKAAEARLRQTLAVSNEVNSTLLTDDEKLAQEVLKSQRVRVLFYPEDPRVRPNLTEKAIVLDDLSVPDVIARAKNARVPLGVFADSFDPKDCRYTSQHVSSEPATVHYH